MHSLKNLNLQPGTKVFVRVDLDVPLDTAGNPLETFRLDMALPTLQYIIKAKAVPVIAGHIGRPGGKIVESLSTKYLNPYFDQALGKGSYELLENLRFSEGEEANSADFAKELAAHASIYVNESFATSHRAHASIVGVPALLPAYAGLRLSEEVEQLSGILSDPKRPFTAIIGGAKLESKLPIISKFLEVADYVLVGGKLASQWQSAVPEHLVLATDYVAEGKDIGSQTVAQFEAVIAQSQSIVWAGPLGLYEEGYLEGTHQIAQAIIDHSVYCVVGGGNTIEALQQIHLLDKFTFVSTGGGAMLEFLINGNLPGLEVLGYCG